jgi:hypothetical protein
VSASACTRTDTPQSGDPGISTHASYPKTKAPLRPCQRMTRKPANLPVDRAVQWALCTRWLSSRACDGKAYAGEI